VFAVLPGAYWGVSLLGFTCFVYRRQWEALTDYYLKKRYPGYDEEFREVARRNILTDFVANRLNPPRSEKLQKRKSRHVWPDFVAFVVIAILLRVFIGLF